VLWTEIFAVFIVSHLVGDFLLQTDWQAAHKHGGLSGDPVRRRALVSHVATYGLAFVPGFIWLASDIGGWIAAVVVAVLAPHLIQDDGRLLMHYMRSVKRTQAAATDFIFIACDQTLHVLALFAVVLVAGS
jgi:Protein of unknown function (DUF3307)